MKPETWMLASLPDPPEAAAAVSLENPLLSPSFQSPPPLSKKVSSCQGKYNWAHNIYTF